MSLILDKLGIYGWLQQDEHKVLGTLLTGDPILMVQTLGSAKSALAKALGKAMGVKVGVYDAAKSMFEDILGIPNPKKLTEGVFEPVETPVTIWDKEVVIIDEVNRADPEMQSKWLEFVRGRTIMGYETQCKWVIGAMNPIDYEGTNVMDPAYIGRFTFFLYPAHFLDMTEAARESVIRKVSDDDAPALRHWAKELKLKADGAIGDVTKYEDVGEMISNVLAAAAPLYVEMVQDMEFMVHFLSRFSVALKEETSKTTAKDKETEPIIIDGRRGGMLLRGILATRACEVAMSNLYGTRLHTLQDTALDCLKSAIPTGLNEAGAKNSEQRTQIERTFRNLESYLDSTRDPRRLDLLYELMATRDITRKVEILLTEADLLGTQNKNSGWTRVLRNTGLDISVLSLVALQVESNQPGTLPPNVIDQLAKKLDHKFMAPKILPLEKHQIPFAPRLTKLVDEFGNDKKKMPMKLMAVAKINEWLEQTSDIGEVSNIPESSVNNLVKQIRESCERLSRMIKTGA